MQFEWDEDKRLENISRRGVDFVDAVAAFDDPSQISISDERHDYGEQRHRLIGTIDNQTYVVVYTIRGAVCRIITAWRVGQSGRRRYQALHDGTD